MLPEIFLPLILAFQPLFSQRVWSSALVLLVGAILAPGKRTVTSILRVMSLSQERQFQRYHRVLNRAIWSSRNASRILLAQLVGLFLPTGPLLLGLDDTIERRWGKRIAARGIYRDPVRSSHSHMVKASGLRWLSLMLLVPIPWAKRTWALPFLTVLAPSERYNQTRRSRHKRLTDWGRQMLRQVRRWWPNRTVYVAADSSFATFEFLSSLIQMSKPVHVITRLGLDAELWQPAPPRQPKQMGRPRIIGPRLPSLTTRLEAADTAWQTIVLQDWYGKADYTLQIISDTAMWYKTGNTPVPIRWVLIRDPQGQCDPQALMCTDQTITPIQIMQWFRQRWQVEVTFEEVRAHLGVETQRQWADQAILRTTPALLALFSIVTALAHQLQIRHSLTCSNTAWYHKLNPTFIDALAMVRQQIWQLQTFQTSTPDTDVVKVPTSLFNTWSELLCYTA